jgi:large conductance mechanosensitive channel
MLNDFKQFIMRGNVVDLAVGVIIGSSFGKIVSSLVDDLIMPPLALVIGKVDFSNLFIPLSFTEKHFNTIAEAKAAGVTTLNVGMFGNVLFQFLLVSFSIFFFIVKPVNKMKRKDDAKTLSTPVPPSRQEILLEEIRDLLKNK